MSKSTDPRTVLVSLMSKGYDVFTWEEGADALAPKATEAQRNAAAATARRIVGGRKGFASMTEGTLAAVVATLTAAGSLPVESHGCPSWARKAPKAEAVKVPEVKAPKAPRKAPKAPSGAPTSPEAVKAAADALRSGKS